MDISFALQTTPDANFYWKLIALIPLEEDMDHSIAHSLLRLFRYTVEHSLSFESELEKTTYSDSIKKFAQRAFQGCTNPPNFNPTFCHVYDK